MQDTTPENILSTVAINEVQSLGEQIANGDFYKFLDVAELDDEMDCESYRHVRQTTDHVICIGVNVYENEGTSAYLVMAYVLDKTTELSCEAAGYIMV